MPGASDIDSALTVVTQDVEGPYNAQGVALIEGLDVLLDAAGEGVSLVSAAAVRSEAVAVCRGGAVSYSANSEIIDLDVGGNDVPLNAPVTDLIDAIGGVLDDSGLNAVVDVNRNVVTELDGGGIAVDALVVSIAGDAVATVTIGHAAVTGATCGAPPECSDTVDNADPEDTVADAEDPGCHTDGNAGNPGQLRPERSERGGRAGVLGHRRQQRCRGHPRRRCRPGLPHRWQRREPRQLRPERRQRGRRPRRPRHRRPAPHRSSARRHAPDGVDDRRRRHRTAPAAPQAQPRLSRLAASTSSASST